MDDLVHFTWDVLEQAGLAQCRDTAIRTLEEGSVFMPHGFSFTTEIEETKKGMILSVAKEQLKSRELFDRFIQCVAGPPYVGKIEAAGFLALLPRSYARELLDVPEVSPGFQVDVVGVLHVEHVYYGVKTWVIDTLRLPAWRLHTDGASTKIPPCLPASAYGTAQGSS